MSLDKTKLLKETKAKLVNHIETLNEAIGNLSTELTEKNEILLTTTNSNRELAIETLWIKELVEDLFDAKTLYVEGDSETDILRRINKKLKILKHALKRG